MHICAHKFVIFVMLISYTTQNLCFYGLSIRDTFYQSCEINNFVPHTYPFSIRINITYSRIDLSASAIR